LPIRSAAASMTLSPLPHAAAGGRGTNSVAKTEFFNFDSQPNYHYFTWLRESGLVDVGELVRKAFEQVEQNEMWHRGFSPSSVALDNLSTMLQDIFEEHVIRALPEYVDLGEGPSPGESLVSSLVSEAAHNIDFGTVAHALLIDCGKWNPTPPEPESGRGQQN
jgi:hypothetical protein